MDEARTKATVKETARSMRELTPDECRVHAYVGERSVIVENADNLDLSHFEANLERVVNWVNERADFEISYRTRYLTYEHEDDAWHIEDIKVEV